VADSSYAAIEPALRLPGIAFASHPCHPTAIRSGVVQPGAATNRPVRSAKLEGRVSARPDGAAQ